MALSRDIVLRLLGDASGAKKALQEAASAAGVTTSAYAKAEREQARQTAAMQKAAQAQSVAHKQIGLAAAAMGAAVALGLGLAVRAAINWESAFAGVAKTVEGTPEQINALEQSLRGLALILPVTHEEIAAVAEAAGQLGIARQDLVAFTATAIALGETTNLSANDAATGLAQLSNVMGTSADDTDRLGSALVALGNNGASTEADILQMAQRIAGAGQVVGLTEGDVLGLASALSSVGIEAEAGGSAISRVLIDMGTAVDEGGAKLEQLAAVAGVTGAEFATLFRDDAASALALFVTGLGQVEAQGGSTFQTLEQLGFSEVRVRDALLRASSASDVLTSSLALGNEAWSENSALLEEAAKRYATTEAQLALARNSLVDAGIDIGNTLIPVLLTLSQVLEGLIGFFTSLPGPVQAVVVGLAAIAAVSALTVGGLTVAKSKMAEFALSAEQAGTRVSGFGKAAAGALGFVGGPWGLALGAAAVVVGALAKRSAEAEGEIRDLTAAIEADSGALGENTRLKLVNQLQTAGLLDDANRAGVALNDLVDAILGEADAYDRVNESLREYVGDSTDAIESGGVRGDLADRLRESIGAESDKVTESVAAYEAQQEALGGSAAAADEAAAANEGLGESIGGVATQAQSLADQIDKVHEAFDALNGVTISSIEAQVRLGDAVRAAQERVAGAQAGTEGYGASLDSATEAGGRNLDALIGIAEAAQAVYEADLALGASTADLDAALEVSRTQIYNTAIALGATEAEARALTDSILAIPPTTEVRVNTFGFDQAIEDARLLAAQIAGIPNYKNVTVNTIQTGGGYFGLASGGMVPGYSPSSTADNIPIMATAREFMQPVAAVDYYGLGFMEAVRSRQFPRFAAGGSVDSRYALPMGYASGGSVAAQASFPSGMQVSGTLDLGNGLIGLIKGVISGTDERKARLSRAGQRRSA